MVGKLLSKSRTVKLTILFSMVLSIAAVVVLINVYGDKQLKPESDKIKSFYLSEVDEMRSFCMKKVMELAGNKDIIEALKTSDKDKCIHVVESALDDVNNNTKYSNFRINLHSNDMSSLFMNWDVHESGDRLNQFKHSLRYARKTKSAVVGFEVGRSGLFIRAVMPIFENDEFIGSVETMAGIDSIVQDMSEKGELMLFLMNENKLDVAKRLKGNDTIHDLVIAQKAFDKALFQHLSDVDTHDLFTKDHMKHEGFLLAGIPIVDVNGLETGITVVAKPLKTIK
ncbi:MAG: cache domain-containing protein [Deferribacterales bacterium]